MSKESKEFRNRVFGCAIIKSINSNYNADFSHQPRTLPDGVIYATDKAYKYTIKNFIINNYTSDRILYWKRLKSDTMNPMDLVEAYEAAFKTTVKDDNREKILQNLLSCLDVRYFGATFAPKGKGREAEAKNISIHGPVQISHGLNRFPKNEIYSEQIMSPFRNPGDEGESEKGASTLGTQAKLREGHYVHHFSINPSNLTALYTLAGKEATRLSLNDIEKLKEAMSTGVTLLDSAAKIGTENELLLWVQLKEDSKLVLPGFTEMVEVSEARSEGKVKIDITRIAQVLNDFNSDIELIEVAFNPTLTSVTGLPEKSITRSL